MASASPNLQQILTRLQQFWADQGCVIMQPYHTEVGAGTFNPATLLRCLGPKPWRTAYVEPSIRPTDGRYGENPYRLQHYFQYQVLIKPSPPDIQEQYLASLTALGIDLNKHDIRFVEDNWEGPTLGAWGTGWEVWCDGMEITQFTYFQQCGGVDLDLVPAEITYGMERLVAFLQGQSSVYQIDWTPEVKYSKVRLAEELQHSVYNFEVASIETLWQLFGLHEKECQRLIDAYKDYPEKNRFPVLPAYDQVLKCSNLFNLLDARGAISVTERVGVIGRVRKLAVGVAGLWLDQQTAVPAPLAEAVAQ